MNAIAVQTLVAFFLSLPTFMVAVGNAWPSYSLKILESDASPLGYKMAKNESNLLSSIIMLGSLSSIPIGLYINDKIGRKRTEILSGLCYVLAWSNITTAKSVVQLVLGRYLIGFGTGIHFVAGVVYVGEVSQASIRGSLLSIMTLMYNIGTLISYIEGWFCSYEVVNYINLTVAVSFVLLLICMKETPVYLLRKGRQREAINSLMFYRGVFKETQEIIDEIAYMKSQLSNGVDIEKFDLETSELKNEKEKLNQDNEIVNVNVTEETESVWRTLCTSKSVQRALIILVINMVMSVFMGMIAIQVYAGQFFGQAVPSLSPHLCSVILAIVVAVTSGLSVVIVDLIPRRVLMMLTCALCAGCMACLATMLRWSWAPEWGIPFVMVLFSFFYHLGGLNIPFIQISECLPPPMYTFGTALSMCSMALANFTVLFVFKPALDAFGLDGVFLLFAFIGLLTTLVTFLIMRETKKVPFEVVQNTFERGFLYRRQKC